MKGLGTSPGISLGRAFIYKDVEIKVEKINLEFPEKEIIRLEKALILAKGEIEDLYRKACHQIGEEEAKIFTAHKMMLEDPEFVGGVRQKILKEKVNVEWAIGQVANQFISIFESMEDEYLKARALDLKDISDRLLRKLLGLSSADLFAINEKSIIIAEDLTPSDTIQMNKEMVVGFITELGGRTSHTSIIARTLGIPAIAGVKNIDTVIEHGDLLIIDGNKGNIIINPNDEELELYQKETVEINKFKKELQSMIGAETITRDGHKILLVGNIGRPLDVDQVLKNDGEGVGLFRTEFLYMDRDRLPTEEEQFIAYKEVAEKLENKSLIIRTLDVGGDKEIAYLGLPKEMNPFLGYRAIRICLDRPDIFKTQLRAIYRASLYGNIKIMFPMISSIGELRRSKEIAKKVRNELESEGLGFSTNVEIGMMVEIPAVAIHSKAFAKEVDFFSIGTNDLIQYTVAVDRGNQNIEHLYNQYHPAVLRLIKMTIDNGHEAGIWVGMCGEAAGDEKLIPILLSMGLDEFSMSPGSILRTRHQIRNMSKKDNIGLIDEILDLARAEDVEKILNNCNFIKKMY